LDRPVEERFDLKPKRLIGDTAYGSVAMLGWLVDNKQIEPHIPVWDETQRTNRLAWQLIRLLRSHPCSWMPRHRDARRSFLVWWLLDL
jgi:hypothetical protein